MNAKRDATRRYQMSSTFRLLLGLFGLLFIWVNRIFLPRADYPARIQAAILPWQTQTTYTLLIAGHIAAALFLIWYAWDIVRREGVAASVRAMGLCAGVGPLYNSGISEILHQLRR